MDDRDCIALFFPLNDEVEFSIHVLVADHRHLISAILNLKVDAPH